MQTTLLPRAFENVSFKTISYFAQALLPLSRACKRFTKPALSADLRSQSAVNLRWRYSSQHLKTSACFFGDSVVVITISLGQFLDRRPDQNLYLIASIIPLGIRCLVEGGRMGSQVLDHDRRNRHPRLLT